MSNVVKNNSKAYGYNYASLGDIVNQGFDIPQMRIKPTEFGEFVEWLDKNGEWQMGSKIVVPDMKGMNAAQAYGSALTYARRYTALMALALVCDDDKALEKQAPVQVKAGDAPQRPAKTSTGRLTMTDKQEGYLRALYAKAGMTTEQADERIAKIETIDDAKAEIERVKESL